MTSNRKPLLVLDVVGLTPKLLAHMPKLRQLATDGFQAPLGTVLPAVTCSVQSTFLTGELPTGHGIVGNGWYFRDLGEVFLWRQHNGLVEGEKLHPVQTAFVEHDGFQCGYCTSGQICSTVGMLAESRQGMPSYVTEDLSQPATELSDAEIRERMSGNICRCAAYPNIVAAIKQAAGMPT